MIRPLTVMVTATVRLEREADMDKRMLTIFSAVDYYFRKGYECNTKRHCRKYCQMTPLE